MADKPGPFTAAPDDSQPQTQVRSKVLRLKYYGAEDVMGVFADQAMVQHTPQTFTLLFFQHQVPPTEDLAELQNMDELPARCVARIILTPQLMAEFLSAMQRNMDKHGQLIKHLQSHEETKTSEGANQ